MGTEFSGAKVEKRSVWRIVITIALIGGLLWGGFGLSADASTVENYKQEQQNVKGEMQSQQKKLDEAREKAKAYETQIDTIEQDINNSQSELESVDVKLNDVKSNIEKNNNELKIVEKQLDVRQGFYNNRLRADYMNNNVGLVEVVFESTTYSDFLTRMDYMERILEQDADLVSAIVEDQKVIQAKKTALEEDQNQLQVLRSSKEEKIAELQNKKGEKNQLLQTAASEVNEIAQAYQELEQTSDGIANKIRDAQQALAQAQSSSSHQLASRGQVVASNGRFAWPLPGGYRNITSSYGGRFHPVLNVYKTHTGVDISAPGGTPIYAAEGGRVISSGWNGGYGNTVIIDHGNGLSTLYAHMSSTGVSAGTTVSTGDVIGRVGSTGWSTGNHLHFEVRINGSHVNPMGYL